MNEQGIDVDEAAEYFGATSSSDSLHAMLAMTREDAFVAFFRQLSDLVLQPGDFDFMEAGNRMACEGGELYYLVAGHLGLMSMSDPLRSFLGQEDSEGKQGLGGVTVSEAPLDALGRLCDPMRLMRLFAVANETGGEAEVRGYLRGLEAHFNTVASSEANLIQISMDLDASLDVAGQILPVQALAGGDASAAALELRPSLPAPKPSAEQAPAETPVPPSPLPDVPSAPSDAPVPLPPQSDDSGQVPLPMAPVDAPPVPEPVVAKMDDRHKDAAAADAFAGAFGSMMAPAPLGEPEPLEESVDEPVSDEERFLAADEDDSGGLSVEELAEATGTDLNEAARLHAAADEDGDGQVTMEEFVGSKAAEVASALPRPVRAAPVRAPVGEAKTKAPAVQPPAAMPQPQPRPMQQAQPQVGGGWPQQQRSTLGQRQPGWGQQPQQGWGQPQPQGWSQPQPMHNVPPTIPSGLRCPGCGVGIDGQWRFCPVCGSRNPAMPY